MDESNHYNNNIDDNNINDNNVTENNTNENKGSNDRKPFLQRLGEANVLPNSMVSAIDNTELVNLAIEKGAKVEQENNR